MATSDSRGTARRCRMPICSTCARCRGFLPVVSICPWQLKPSETIKVCSPARAHLRATGAARRCASRRRTCRASYPNEPAIPQQPESSTSHRADARGSAPAPSSHPSTALWWQCPCTIARRSTRGGRQCGALARRNAAERVRLPREPLRVHVVGKEPEQLVAEDGDAARLQPDHRRARARSPPRASSRICRSLRFARSSIP